MRRIERRQSVCVGLAAILGAVVMAGSVLPAHAKKGSARGAGSAEDLQPRGRISEPAPAAAETPAQMPVVVNGEKPAQPAAAPAAPTTPEQTAADAAQNAADAMAAAGSAAAKPQTNPQIPKAATAGQGGAGVVNQTAYARKGRASGPQMAAQPSRLPVPEAMFVECNAGCDKGPGQVVQNQRIDPAIQVANQPRAVAVDASKTSTVVCMAGCYDSPVRLAGRPEETQSGSASVRLTSAPVPTVNAKQSGAWMTRINRERAQK